MMPDVAQAQRGIENFEHVVAEIRMESYIPSLNPSCLGGMMTEGVNYNRQEWAGLDIGS